MSNRRLSHRQELGDLPINVLAWIAKEQDNVEENEFQNQLRETPEQRQSRLNREEELDKWRSPKIRYGQLFRPRFLNFDPNMMDLLLEYVTPREYFVIFYHLHKYHDTLNRRGVKRILDHDLNILSPWDVYNMFAGEVLDYLPYVGPVPRMFNRNDIFESICDNIVHHIRRGDENDHKDPEWQNQLRELYEKLIQYYAGALSVNHQEQIRRNLMYADPEMDPDVAVNIDILKYIAFDIRKMLDLYFEAYQWATTGGSFSPVFY